MEHYELLGRLGVAMKEQIAPAVEGEYPRTQAFMAAVILDKVSRSLALADEHARAGRLDIEALHADLAGLLGEADGAVPATVAEAWATARTAGTYPALAPLLHALYAHREALGADRFDDAVARVRVCLRAHVDRAMEVAAS